MANQRNPWMWGRSYPNAATAAAKPAPTPEPAPEPVSELRDDGPTIQEFVDAGHRAVDYPPEGYASKSTDEEVAAAIELQERLKGKNPSTVIVDENEGTHATAPAASGAAAVSVTPPETPEPAALPADARTHAQIDEWVSEQGIETPEGWGGFTIAAKQDHLKSLGRA